MAEYIRRQSVKIAIVDDNAGYLGKIEEWCSSHRIAFEPSRHVFETIGEFETFLVAFFVSRRFRK